MLSTSVVLELVLSVTYCLVLELCLDCDKVLVVDFAMDVRHDLFKDLPCAKRAVHLYQRMDDARRKVELHADSVLVQASLKIPD